MKKLNEAKARQLNERFDKIKPADEAQSRNLHKSNPACNLKIDPVQQ